MKQFKCRCSGIGEIMTAPRAKSETISATAKTFLLEWAVEEWSGRRKELESKYLTKGIDCEDASIELASDVLGFEFTKNEAFFDNDFLTLCA